MDFVVEVDGRPMRTRVEPLAGNRLRLWVDDVATEVDVATCRDGFLSLLTEDKRSVSARIEPHCAPHAPGRVLSRGHYTSARVMSPRTFALHCLQATQKEQDGVKEVIAPMAGKVVAVSVSDGDVVESGQGLVVIEAMKMENELRAPASGTVRHLSLRVGDVVDNQAIVCTVERAGDKG